MNKSGGLPLLSDEQGEFFIHVGGVFNNQLCGGVDPGCARCKVAGCATSIPHRAAIPNPFQVVASIVGTANNAQAGTALDLQHGLFSNVTAASVAAGGTRVTTTLYAHRGLRSLLVLEVAAEFDTATEDGDEGSSSVTVGLDRCGGGSIDWSALADFNLSSTSSTARSLVVTSMEEDCDSGHYCPMHVALDNCGGLGRCNNPKMPPRSHTEVGIAYEQVPPTLTLTPAEPICKFLVAIHTSLEPGLSAPGAAATAAAATLAQYGAGSNSTAASLRRSHEAAWEEEWRGGIEVAGNLTIASTVVWAQPASISHYEHNHC